MTIPDVLVTVAAREVYGHAWFRGSYDDATKLARAALAAAFAKLPECEEFAAGFTPLMTPEYYLGWERALLTAQWYATTLNEGET